MPVERTSISSSQTAFRRVKWEARTVAIVAKPNVQVRARFVCRIYTFDLFYLQSIVQAACKHFRVAAPKEEFVLLGQLDGDELELTDESLDLLPSKSVLILSRIALPLLPTVNVEPTFAGMMGARPAPASTSEPYPEGKINLKFWPYVFCIIFSASCAMSEAGIRFRRHMNRREADVISVRMHATSTFRNAMVMVSRKLGHDCMFDCDDDLGYVFGGLHINRDLDTPLSLGMSDGDTIDVYERQVGGKPVIYLFPTEPLENATVAVRLVPQWTFTHIYPLTDKKTLDDGKESVIWFVSAGVDGTLVEKGSNRELSYLFWEAASNPTVPESPPLTGHDNFPLEHFDPAFPTLEPHSPTAVLLSFKDLLPYLDETLKSLTLHTSARNDFITYWLPKLSKQPYVALRFLPQAVYERAAQLEVTPAPDVVTRVFMLFRGVAAEDVDELLAARERVGRVDWVEVVGVAPSALDSTRFRVLEWGAMEVL